MGHANALKNQTIDSNIQWMVFKIKQKAKYDYNEFLGNKAIDTNNQLIDAKTIGLFSNTNTNLFADVKYSYNWPYDYFSLVELAEIKVVIDLEKPDNDSSTKIFTSSKTIPSTSGRSLVSADLSSTAITLATTLATTSTTTESTATDTEPTDTEPDRPFAPFLLDVLHGLASADSTTPSIAATIAATEAAAEAARRAAVDARYGLKTTKGSSPTLLATALEKLSEMEPE